MNPKSAVIARVLTAFVLASGVTASFTGCASSKDRAKTEAVSSVSEFRKNLDAMPNNIEQTVAALSELRAGNNTNRAASFRKFSEQFSWMQNRAAELGAQADKATANSQKYFRDWLADSMKSKSPAERQEVMDRIDSRKDLRDQALSYLTSGRAKYQEFAGQLRDIQNALRGNFSQANIDALSNQFTKINQTSIDVRDYIDRLDEQIDAILATK